MRFANAKSTARCLAREVWALFTFLAALFSVTFPAVMSAEKPFSLNDTPGKLPKDAVPTDYSIRIVPNIDRFTFAGTETMKLVSSSLKLS
jgi:hypothetical protein